MNAIGSTQLRDLINSVLVRWHVCMLIVWTDAVTERTTAVGRRGEKRREEERSPRVSTRFSLRVENEQTNAGRNGRPCFKRPNSQAPTGKGNINLLTRSADHEQDRQPYPVGS